MDFKKKFLKYQSKYNKLIGSAYPVRRRNTIDFAYMDEVATVKNEFVGSDRDFYEEALFEICRRAQSSDRIRLEQQQFSTYTNSKAGFQRGFFNMGNIHFVGGSALYYFDKIISIMSGNSFSRIYEKSPRTNDFDVSLYLERYSKDQVDALISIITDVLDLEFVYDNLSDAFEDFTEYDEVAPGEILIRLICANKLQITVMDRDNFVNVRVNYKLNGEPEHLYEFVIWKDNSKKTFTRYLAHRGLPIGMPDIYQLVLNYIRVMYRRSRKNIPKCRQDYARLLWAWEVIQNIYESGSTKFYQWITESQITSMRESLMRLEEHLPFCHQVTKPLERLNYQRDDYFQNHHSPEDESSVKRLFEIQGMDYDDRSGYFY